MHPKRTSPRPRVARSCRRCDAPFTALQSAVDKGQGNYCSQSCARLGSRNNLPLLDRLMSFVDKNGPIPSHRPDLGPCWIWTGYVRPTSGYGQFNPFPGAAAHRASWTYVNGPIPEGMNVCHHCDERRCVRPDHLFLGTQSENMQDAKAKGRIHLDGIGGRRGSNNARSILTEDQVRDIRNRHANGTKVADLAREYGVGSTTISATVNRKNWRHVD